MIRLWLLRALLLATVIAIPLRSNPSDVKAGLALSARARTVFERAGYQVDTQTVRAWGNQTKANEIVLTQRKDDDPGEVLANAVLAQNLRHGHVAAVFGGGMMSNTGETLELMACAKFVQERAALAIGGDLSFASAMLASQAISLDTMFSEFARRAASNMGQHLDAADRYARLAMKAQAGSRATLEALAKLHQPREQTVRHVHVNEGGQAVIADQFHHHAGGQGNGTSTDQPHAQSSCGSALSCPDPFGNGVPIPGDQGGETVPDARRER